LLSVFVLQFESPLSSKGSETDNFFLNSLCNFVFFFFLGFAVNGERSES